MIYEIKNIKYAYPGEERKVLNDVTLDVQQGEILSILGPNGAGKSTLLNCMMGLFVPEEGEILLNGKNVNRMERREIASCVSYVQQTHVPQFPYTVLDFVLMGCAPKIGMFRKPKKEDEEMAIEALVTMGIEHMANIPYTDLSGGERQQVTIAQAIVTKPQVLLFDEPTSHLDYGNQLRILRLVKRMSESGYTVVMTTHNPDHAILLGGRTAILDRSGKLECGDTKEMLTQERLQQVYQADVRLMYIEEVGRNICISGKL